MPDALEVEHSSASFSGDEVYRYDLVREWGADDSKLLAWVMLNPSTATADVDDMTIRRVRGFSKRWGFGGFVGLNLYGLRSTDPRALLTADDPVGPGNVETVLRWLGDGRVGGVVAAWGAWGAHGKLNSPVRRLIEAGARDLLEPAVQCLGTTVTGEPLHPLYLEGTTELRPWP